MSYLSAHFQRGASYLISRANYHMYICDRPMIGRWNEALSRGELFVAPREEIDYLLKTYPNQPRVWEKALGLDPGSLGETPMRVDIYNPYDYNLRTPDGLEIGYTGEGTPGITGVIPEINEGVIDLVPNPEENPEVGRVTSAVDVTVEEKVEEEEKTEVRESVGPDGSIETETVTTHTVTKETTVTVEGQTNSNENSLDDGMGL